MLLPKDLAIYFFSTAGPEKEARKGSDMKTQDIMIRDEIIRLGQFLKVAGVVETGGEAKLRIQNGEARVNGVVETRRGRQLVHGDLVEFAGFSLRVGGEPG